MAKNANEIKALQLRIPEWLRAKVASSASENDQSMNAELISRVAGSFESERQDLSFRTAVAALAGSGENAQLLSMLSSALQLATSHSKDKSSPEAMDSFREAINLIVLAHSGRPIEPVSAETVFDMTDAKHRGYMIADVILGQHDLPRPVYIPPELQKEIEEQQSSGITLANLGRGVTLDYIGRMFSK